MKKQVFSFLKVKYAARFQIVGRFSILMNTIQYLSLNTISFNLHALKHSNPMLSREKQVAIEQMCRQKKLSSSAATACWVCSLSRGKEMKNTSLNWSDCVVRYSWNLSLDFFNQHQKLWNFHTWRMYTQLFFNFIANNEITDTTQNNLFLMA